MLFNKEKKEKMNSVIFNSFAFVAFLIGTYVLTYYFMKFCFYIATIISEKIDSLCENKKQKESDNQDSKEISDND